MDQSNKKSLQFLDNFWLRIIAMVFMVIDHVGVLMANYQTDIGSSAPNIILVCRILGRIAFPLFIFMMAEGMHYTRNGWKYMARIGAVYGLIIVALTIYIFGIAKQPSLMHGFFPGPNPFTDLVLLGFLLFALNSKAWKKLLALIPAAILVLGHVVNALEASQQITIVWFPMYLRPDYGLFGLAIALAFYFARPLTNFMAKRACSAYEMDYETYIQSGDYQRNFNIVSMILYISATVLLWALSYFVYDPYNMPLQTYCLLATPILFFYSGKRGYNAKWWRIFSYSFFPVHLIILFLIFFVSFGHV